MKYGITKDHSSFLYGIAIIFMIYHHLFCIPSRIQYPYFSVLDNIFPFPLVSLERTLAWFAKICVAIYAFISGYGLYKSIKIEPEKGVFKNLGYSFKKIFKKLSKLLLKLLIVLSIFVPLLILVNHRKITFSEFILNLVGFSSSLNGVFWYVNFYIGVLLLFPFLNMIFTRSTNKNTVQIIVSFACLALVICWMIFGRGYVPEIEYFIVFVEGYLISRFKLFERISKPLSNNVEIAISVVLLIACFVLRILFATDAAYHSIDMFIIAPFIYSTCCLVEKTHFLKKGFCYFGRYSTFIWLSHTFFAYDLMPRIITISGNSTVIFIECSIISLLTAILLQIFEKYLIKLFSIIKNKILALKNQIKNLNNLS